MSSVTMASVVMHMVMRPSVVKGRSVAVVMYVVMRPSVVKRSPVPVMMVVSRRETHEEAREEACLHWRCGWWGLLIGDDDHNAARRGGMGWDWVAGRRVSGVVALHILLVPHGSIRFCRRGYESVTRSTLAEVVPRRGQLLLSQWIASRRGECKLLLS